MADRQIPSPIVNMTTRSAEGELAIRDVENELPTFPGHRDAGRQNNRASTDAREDEQLGTDAWRFARDELA
jgi:hypothetical protein